MIYKWRSTAVLYLSKERQQRLCFRSQHFKLSVELREEGEKQLNNNMSAIKEMVCAMLCLCQNQMEPCQLKSVFSDMTAQADSAVWSPLPLRAPIQDYCFQ